MFSYDVWASQQTEKVRSAVNRLACIGIFDESVFCLPSSGATAGELVVMTESEYNRTGQPLEVVRFHTRVSAISSAALYQSIWNACRRLPICPTA